jgi:hypothetical protein
VVWDLDHCKLDAVAPVSVLAAGVLGVASCFGHIGERNCVAYYSGPALGIDAELSLQAAGFDVRQQISKKEREVRCFSRPLSVPYLKGIVMYWM